MRRLAWLAVVLAASLFLLAWPLPESGGNGRAAGGPDPLRVWLRAGGLRHLDAITEEIGGVVRAIGDDAVDLPAMRDASVRLRAAAMDASRYPNPPGGKQADA